MLRAVLAARAKGTKLAAATLSGMALLVHGPMLHHELRLLVKAGLTPLEALRAATSDAADCLGAPRAGRLGAGLDATLVVVEGNPFEEISSTERIDEVFFHGENVRRGELVEKQGPENRESGTGTVRPVAPVTTITPPGAQNARLSSARG